MENHGGTSPIDPPEKKKRPYRRKPKENKENIAESKGATPEGRDNKGRFQPGNKLSIGNKGQAGERQRLMCAFRKCATEGDMEKLYKQLLKMALKGNIKAIEVLLDRLLGKAESFDSLTIDGSMEFNRDETFL